MEDNKIYVGLELDENKIIKSWCLPADCCEIKGNIDTSKCICGLSKFIDGELVNPSDSEIEAWKQAQEEKRHKQERIGELKWWFDNKYRQFNEKLTRYEALHIIETITDDFRDKTYSNLTELYNEAEVVRTEIHSLEI